VVSGNLPKGSPLKALSLIDPFSITLSLGSLLFRHRHFRLKTLFAWELARSCAPVGSFFPNSNFFEKLGQHSSDRVREPNFAKIPDDLGMDGASPSSYSSH